MFPIMHVDFSLVESRDEKATVMEELQVLLDDHPIIMIMKAEPGSLVRDGIVHSSIFVEK